MLFYLLDSSKCEERILILRCNATQYPSTATGFKQRSLSFLHPVTCICTSPCPPATVLTCFTEYSSPGHTKIFVWNRLNGNIIQGMLELKTLQTWHFSLLTFPQLFHSKCTVCCSSLCAWSEFMVYSNCIVFIFSNG